MPLDPNKLTHKTSEALGAAQSLARERNHSQVTPEHLLAALVSQPESVVLPVLERVGVSSQGGARPGRRGARPPAPGLRADRPAGAAVHRRVRGARSGRRAAQRPRRRLPLHRAPAPRHDRRRRRRGRSPPRARRHARRGLVGVEGSARQPPRHEREPRRAVPGARALRPRPHRGRAQGQARSGDRTRRRDPSRHPGALAPHQEQPGAHRRARRGQDRHRRGARAAHRRG